MTGRLFTGWKALLGVSLLTALAWAGWPVAASAEVLIFRNDTKVPLVVQGMCVVNGKLVRDQPMPVQAGGMVKIVLPGNKVINIYEARPPSIQVFQGTLPASLEDQMYSIQVDPLTGKARVDRIKPMGP